MVEAAVAWWQGVDLGAGGFPGSKPDSTEDPQCIGPTSFRWSGAEVPDVVTLHWDDKLLPALSARKSKEERLPIVISYGFKKQLITVPRLDNSTGKEQAQAVWKAVLD
ncbi:hypothetical protein AVEN_207620-1 [Araneus ventricosus]|uniref:Uncharacterized protein n=1 Tax=Araneus ventricosus TaxID=182803 RepID=A0A4Y2H9V7_ARAVE|nr:hypothetical protein AVEN_207620-1 [Araneus ventricosus]